MYRIPNDQRHRLTILLLIALRKLGGEFTITTDDVEWTKKQNIQVVENNQINETHVSLLKKHKQLWPP